MLNEITTLDDLLQRADETVAGVFGARYRTDPLLGELSRLNLISNSLTRIHGLLLEDAIATALRQCPGIEVCQNLRFPITDAARALVVSNRTETLDKVQLTFDAEARITYDIDLAAVSSDGSRCWAVDVKRGAGITGGTRRAAVERELLSVKLLLRSFFRQQGYNVDSADVAIIDVYGSGGFSPRLTVSRDHIDRYFGLPVLPFIESLDQRLKEKIKQGLTKELMSVASSGIPPSERARADRGTLSDQVNDTPVAPVKSRWNETFAATPAKAVRRRSREEQTEAPYAAYPGRGVEAGPRGSKMDDDGSRH